MTNRIKSIELMRKLQPFTQTGVISSARAMQIIADYARRNENQIEGCLLSVFIADGSIPSYFTPLIEEIRKEYL